MNFGKKVRAIRAAAGDMSREEFAEFAEISVNALDSVEQDKPYQKKTENKVLRAISKLGFRLTENGLEFTELATELLTGPHRIIDLLEDVGITKLYINGADESQTPPEIIEKVSAMRREGLEIKHFVCEGDTHLLGDVSEYRWVPKKHFTNQVRFVYDDTLAIFSKEQIILIRNVEVAEAEKRMMDMLWHLLPQPDHSTAENRYV